MIMPVKLPKTQQDFLDSLVHTSDGECRGIQRKEYTGTGGASKTYYMLASVLPDGSLGSIRVIRDARPIVGLLQKGILVDGLVHFSDSGEKITDITISKEYCPVE